jgi:hypothetical protein
VWPVSQSPSTETLEPASANYMYAENGNGIVGITYAVSSVAAAADGLGRLHCCAHGYVRHAAVSTGLREVQFRRLSPKKLGHLIKKLLGELHR